MFEWVIGNNTIVAWVSSAVLSIGAIWTILSKYRSKIRKVMRIAIETLDVIDAIDRASEDRKFTAEEIEHIRLEMNELIRAVK